MGIKYIFSNLETKISSQIFTMKRIVGTLGAAFSLILLVSAMKSVAVTVDLYSKGIPISVDAPNGATIRSGLMDGMEMENGKTLNWEINKGEFSLDVSMQDADMTQTKTEYVRYSKSVAQKDKSFVRFVESDMNGFLVMLSFNGAIEYDFYHVVEKDKRAIEFSVGLGTSDYSLENIRKIYHAAQTAH